MNSKNLSHYGDIIAIPFFVLLFFYFYNIDKKTRLEYILMYFCLIALLADIFYTYLFFSNKTFYVFDN
jgi:hypothetical protein